jgi:hypothetical protein
VFHATRRRVTSVLFVSAVVVLAASSGASGRSAAVPSFSAEPFISGTPVVGNVLTGHNATWSGTAPITYASQWARCDETGFNCAAISGATDAQYTLVSADLGHTMRFRVTAKNAEGSNKADSNETGVVSKANGEPASTKPPVVTGNTVVGSSLHTSTGSWVGDKPVTFSYHWLRCDRNGNACSTIQGETAAGYTLVDADSTKTVRSKVIATNSKGDSLAISDQTAVVSGGSGGTTTTTAPPSGSSIDVSQVPKDGRLVVADVKFSPNPVTSRNQQITVKIRVEDNTGRPVRNALVFFRSTPLVTSTPTDAPTGDDGWVTYRVQPQNDFPIKNGYSVQFYAKAYRKGDPTLGGIYGSRLVQVATRTP